MCEGERGTLGADHDAFRRAVLDTIDSCKTAV